jgi:hypothetical protein
MSDSSTGRYVAIGLIAVIVVLLGLAVASGKEREQDAKRANCAAANCENKVQFTTPRSGVPAIAESFVSDPEPQNGNDREKRDLAAQESMAVWAFWMVVASFGTMLVTLLGTILIWRQVSLTREAVEDTGKATAAMVRQNELTEAAQRPFVIIEPVEKPTDRKPLVKSGTFQYVNYGKSPARIVRQHFASIPKGKRRLSKSSFNPKRKGKNLPDGIVVPSGERLHTLLFASDVETERVTGLQMNFTKPGLDGMGEHYIMTEGTYFLGYIIYSDLAESFWCRRFCFTCEGDDIRLVETSDALNTEYRCNRDGTPYDDSRHHERR